MPVAPAHHNSPVIGDPASFILIGRKLRIISISSSRACLLPSYTMQMQRRWRAEYRGGGYPCSFVVDIKIA